MTALFCVGCGEPADPTVAPEAAGKITVIAPEHPAPAVTANAETFLGYDVKGETIIRYAPSGEETQESKSVAPYVVIRNQPFASIHQSLRAKRLSKNFIVKCSACHDKYSNGVIGPSLLTKTGDEVYDKIIRYKTDQESNILMRQLIQQMDNTEIRFIADDIAKFNKEVREEQRR
ncbi:MAG: hypothetical protein LBG61_06820 [Burkholderiales bacterium]|nr:hypothetical protein [Burkholderiales bacterium]